MAITGVHLMLNTPEAEALRAQLRDLFGFDHVDAGEGWLIFSMPPAEMGVHPNETTHHEISFHCDDLDATLDDLASKGIEVVHGKQDHGYGLVARVWLAGGVEVDVYEPRHPTAVDGSAPG